MRGACVSRPRLDTNQCFHSLPAHAHARTHALHLPRDDRSARSGVSSAPHASPRHTAKQQVLGHGLLALAARRSGFAGLRPLLQQLRTEARAVMSTATTSPRCARITHPLDLLHLRVDLGLGAGDLLARLAPVLLLDAELERHPGGTQQARFSAIAGARACSALCAAWPRAYFGMASWLALYSSNSSCVSKSQRCMRRLFVSILSRSSSSLASPPAPPRLPNVLRTAGVSTAGRTRIATRTTDSTRHSRRRRRRPAVRPWPTCARCSQRARRAGAARRRSAQTRLSGPARTRPQCISDEKHTRTRLPALTYAVARLLSRERTDMRTDT